MQWQRFMDMPTFNQYFKQADLIISHAGMGNIITALEGQKPIIVMNRQHALGEHRNDHQADGLAWMAKLPGVYTASTETELHALLNQRQSLSAAPIHTQNRRQALVDFLDQTLQARLAL
jgi:UDP-N-acetylglucosamine transferase subunit ALG13